MVLFTGCENDKEPDDCMGDGLLELCIHGGCSSQLFPDDDTWPAFCYLQLKVVSIQRSGDFELCILQQNFQVSACGQLGA